MTRVIITIWAMMIVSKFSAQAQPDSFSEAEAALKEGNHTRALNLAEGAFRAKEKKGIDDYLFMAKIAAAAHQDSSALGYLRDAVVAGLYSSESIDLIPQFGEIKKSKAWAGLIERIKKQQVKQETVLMDSSERAFSFGAFDSFIDHLKGKAPEDIYSALVNKNTGYAQPAVTGQSYLCFIENKDFGKVPFKIYIPKSYVAGKKHPALMYLHGASTFFSFSMAAGNYLDNDEMLNRLKREDKYIIIVPLADRTTRFNWALNKKTFTILTEQIVLAKKILNIDDRRVFIYGHSDGGRGAFAYMCLNPSLFAGSVTYNGSPSLLFNKIYIHNLINSQPYIVHSDLDNINPFQDMESAIKLIQSQGGNIFYKLYNGYQHEDKHLDLDYSNSISYLENHTRKPMNDIYWQTDEEGSGVGYLIVKQIDLSRDQAPWASNMNFKYFNKRDNIYSDRDMYAESAAATITGQFSDNVFTVNTSRIKTFQILIDPTAVKIGEPVTVVLNGKIVSKEKVFYNKDFMIERFKRDADRNSVYVNYINVSVP